MRAESRLDRIPPNLHLVLERLPLKLLRERPSRLFRCCLASHLPDSIDELDVLRIRRPLWPISMDMVGMSPKCGRLLAPSESNVLGPLKLVSSTEARLRQLSMKVFKRRVSCETLCCVDDLAEETAESNFGDPPSTCFKLSDDLLKVIIMAA